MQLLEAERKMLLNTRDVSPAENEFAVARRHVPPAAPVAAMARFVRVSEKDTPETPLAFAFVKAKVSVLVLPGTFERICLGEKPSVTVGGASDDGALSAD